MASAPDDERGRMDARGLDKARSGCPYRLETDWPLFLKKSLFVVVLSYALVPLIAFKQHIPAALFTSGLVVLHVLILVVYVYKVKIRQLDPDWRAFSGRLVAIAFAVWLLDLATRLEGGTDVGKLCLNMLVLCLAHCFVLALLTVRVVRSGDQPLLPVTSPITPTEPLTFSDNVEAPSRGAQEGSAIGCVADSTSDETLEQAFSSPAPEAAFASALSPATEPSSAQVLE